jgi:sulfite exporter TauE/SafE
VLALAGSVLLTSLLGSPHCAGMCGGFVVFYAGHETRRRGLAHLAYNAGRLASYVALGLLAGTLGAGVEHMGAVVGVGRAAAWLAGTVMVIWGGVTLLQALGVRGPARAPVPGVHALLARALQAVSAQPAEVRGLTMGLLSTLLPCGWLYTYVAVAAGTGSAIGGAIVMAVFWVGTVPVMAGLGLLARSTLGGLRRRLPVAAAMVMIVLGVLTLAGKIRPHVHGMGGMHGTHGAAQVDPGGSALQPSDGARQPGAGDDEH